MSDGVSLSDKHCSVVKPVVTITSAATKITQLELVE